MSNFNKPVTVLASANSSIISVAESLLKEAGINYSVSLNGITEILVKGDEDSFKARKILADLEELDFRDER
jgi:hypothetical protein